MFRSIALPELMVLIVVGLFISFVFGIFVAARRAAKCLGHGAVPVRWNTLAIWISVAFIIATGMYPPWVQSWEYAGGNNQIRIGPGAEGYSWIFQPSHVPAWVDQEFGKVESKESFFLALKIPGFWRSQIDLARLGVEWAIIAAVLAATLATVRHQKSTFVATLTSGGDPILNAQTDSRPTTSNAVEIRRTNDSPKACPSGGLTNPGAATRCDCGYDLAE
ncbi:MAG TPA: hypothetical protein VEU96_30570 [Bryobacteraceae bacterium]|nr:hypothetical protein [Bryobacteraceae bacterium]